MSGARKRAYVGARVVKVIEVTFTRGEGTDDDVARRVVAYFDEDGHELAERDLWGAQNMADRLEAAERLADVPDHPAARLDPRDGQAERAERQAARTAARRTEALAMTIVDDIVAQLRRGECSARRRHDAPCATCDEVDARILFVLALADVAAAARPYRDRSRSLICGRLVDGCFVVEPDPIADPIAEALDDALAKVAP